MTRPQEPLRRKFSDAAHRIADIVGMHFAADRDATWMKWAAFALSDGRSDNNVYDTKEDAARHQVAPEYCLYIHMVDAITPQEAETLLNVNRQIYDAGYRSDPDNPVVFGDGGNILRPLELKQWETSGLTVPQHLTPNRQTRRNRKFWEGP